MLQHNLNTIRKQIEIYKLQHGGRIPLLYKGEFPQLSSATNSNGTPGARGKLYPLGPYLPGGLPINPYSGVSTVELIDTQISGASNRNVGWLYNQETGRIEPARRAESP